MPTKKKGLPSEIACAEFDDLRKAEEWANNMMGITENVISVKVVPFAKLVEEQAPQALAGTMHTIYKQYYMVTVIYRTSGV